MAVTPDGSGYWIASSSGEVAACGDAPALGDGASGTAAIATAPRGDGYWLVTGAGSVQAFGSAVNHGGLPAAVHLAKPIVAMAANPITGGYWLLGGDGGVFSYDAPFYGSTGNIHLARPAVGLEATLTGKGYRFVAADGGIFDYGDAKFYGSTGGIVLNKPVVGMADDPVTGGYWLDASDGGIFSFHAPFYGSTGNINLAQPCVGMTAMPRGDGYRFVAADGGIFDFGSAPFEGSAAFSTPTTATLPFTLASLAGTWQAHDERIVFDTTGTGQLTYPDFTVCPSCSAATAPVGTIVFVLTSITNNLAAGSVTASSDPTTATVGEAVQVTLTAGSPGQLLHLDIGGGFTLPYCNAAAEATGQCGA